VPAGQTAAGRGLMRVLSSTHDSVRDGGTKVVVSGVDFWANGAPPRKFSILGFVTSKIESGTGIVRMIPPMYMATDVKTMRFAVVKYVQ